MNTAKKFTLILIFIIAVAALGGLLFLRVTAAPEPDAKSDAGSLRNSEPYAHAHSDAKSDADAYSDTGA